MTRYRLVFVALLGLAIALLVQSRRRAVTTSSETTTRLAESERASFPTQAGRHDSSADAAVAYASALHAAFRRELLRAEVELEQVRYGPHFWDAPLPPASAEIEARRAELARQLNAAIRAHLLAEFPEADVAPPTVEPFFDPDHPAPNLAFLSADSRERVLARIAALPADASRAPAALLALAEETLSGAELADYRHWNEPEARAVRAQLAGFAPDQPEFAAIRAWQAAHAGGGEANDAWLASQLGAARYAEFKRHLSPDVQTALRDAERLGLTLTEVDWLADYRREFVAQLQVAWNDATLLEPQRSARVAQLHASARAAICVRLGLSPLLAREIEPLP